MVSCFEYVAGSATMAKWLTPSNAICLLSRYNPFKRTSHPVPVDEHAPACLSFCRTTFTCERLAPELRASSNISHIVAGSTRTYLLAAGCPALGQVTSSPPPALDLFGDTRAGAGFGCGRSGKYTSSKYLSSARARQHNTPCCNANRMACVPGESLRFRAIRCFL